MKTNRGFTLIELIVVVTIIAILAGGMTIGVNLLILSDTESCVKEINVSLDKLRLETMSKGDQYHYIVIELRPAAKSYYLNIIASNAELDEADFSSGTVLRSRKIADAGITIAFSDHTDGTGSITVDAANPLLICFEPGSGAFKSSARQITVISRVQKSTIYMVKKTGKHYIG